jgi:hypothetical protein
MFSFTLFAENSLAYKAGFAVGSAFGFAWPFLLGAAIIYLGYRFFIKRKMIS